MYIFCSYNIEIYSKLCGNYTPLTSIGHGYDNAILLLRQKVGGTDNDLSRKDNTLHYSPGAATSSSYLFGYQNSFWDAISDAAACHSTNIVDFIRDTR
jgi:hypothetical protein